MKRFDIRGDDGSLYLTRWTLLTLFGWRLTLHKMHRADADLCPHDHPWAFLSLVLWGGYVEEVERTRLVRGDVMYAEARVRERRWNRPGILLYRPATWRHRIAELPNGPAWTLLVRGPDVREWGFWGATGWLDWRSYFRRPQSSRIAWCETSTPESHD